MNERRLQTLEARLTALENASGKYVDDAALDKPHGDPLVPFCPRDWRGEDFAKRPYSACTPEFLEMLAGSLEWAAEHPKAGKEKYAEGNRRDAARARSWARRIRMQDAERIESAGPLEPARMTADGSMFDEDGVIDGGSDSLDMFDDDDPPDAGLFDDAEAP